MMAKSNGTEARVQVAVRARPLNQREIDLKSPVVVQIHGSQIFVNKSQENRHHTPKAFSYDFCFDSMRLDNSSYASQEYIFDKLGLEIVKHAFEGYNACIFAYGQTGSGKSYTMMGIHNDRGIIPRLSQSMFDRIENEIKQELNNDLNIEPIANDKLQEILSLKFSSSYRVEVSYFEIYNEKVRDLLNPNNNHHALKVRENKILGPYVDGLSQLVVTSYQEIETLLIEGNNYRTVASTNMNNESSRSHAVFTLKLTQTLTTDASETQSVKVSKISLVDLAGSERVSKSGIQIEQTRFREGCNINKSLSTLGLVISALATRQTNEMKSTKKTFVPYRDSVLTWLLKDSLGGNSFTIMLATISPAYDNYEETISTLRYADQAKKIVNHAVINEDEPGTIIRELRNEIDLLRKELADAKAEKSAEKLNAEINENEKLMQTITKDWQERIAETDKISKERHELLEKSGISVCSSGIGLEKDRLYLVNLNPDPALNELLVYYLKTVTTIGRPDASIKQDIELIGVGISPEHCIIEIRTSNQIYLIPLNKSRTYVNGQLIDNERQLRHGDRILLGCSHFFRLNFPGDRNSSNNNSVLSSMMNSSSHLSFIDAQNEFLLHQLAADPMTKELRLFLKQDETNQDTNRILPKKTSDVYEREIESLKAQLMRNESRSSTINSRNRAFEESLSKWRFSNRLLNESEESRSFFNRLKQELIRVNAIVSEANTIASEMQRQTTYTVMLQIPVSYLKPSERATTNLCEPTIQVKRRNYSPQIWNIEKFESKLNDMREVYYEWQMSENKGQLLAQQQKRNDPFFDVEDYNCLVGVANIFLKALFYDSKLDYFVPIINTQGEISGSLHVVLVPVGPPSMKKLSDFQSTDVPRASISEGISIDADENSLSEHSNSQNSLDDESFDDSTEISNNKTDQMTVKFAIKEVRDLPPSDAENVMCRYTFIHYKEDQIIVSIKPSSNVDDDEEDTGKKPRIFSFNHEKEYTFSITDNFISTCLESAISIEVWYHYSSIPLSINTTINNERNRRDAEIRALSNRWKEVKRHIQYAVEIHELDASGRWEPVEVDAQQPQIISGGVYRLRQGQSKRLVTRLRVIPQSGTMPLVLHAIRSVEIGSISTRKINAPRQLDSYQDEELQCLRREWLDLIEKRKLYLESEVKMLSQQTNKTPNDLERETTLLEQLVRLAEERNFAEFPPTGSGIPGSPPCWTPPPTIEEHRPLIFLNLDPVNMNTENDTAGLKATLNEENKNDMFRLPLLHHASDEVRAVAQWDPSIHEATEMNRVTPNNTIIYMIVKIIVLISQPVRMELVLRKRIATTIGKTDGWWSGKAMKYLLGYKPFKRTSVVYEIVSSIPKYIHEIEDRKSLALVAGSECHTQNYVEKYIQYASAVDSLLLLDKLRQEVSLAENSAKQQTLRKATSVPNIANQQGNPTLSIAPMNSRRDNDDDHQLSIKKSPSIQGESSIRSNPFYDETKTAKSSFLYPHETNTTTSQIKTLNTPFSAFSRSELNVSTPMSTNNHNETQHSYFESTTPSLLSRSLFIEQEQLQPVQSSSIRIRHPFDIDDHENSTTKKSDDHDHSDLLSLEQKYSIATTPRRIINPDQNIEPIIKKIVDINDEEYPIGCRVLVNTDHHIFNKLGVVRYVGKTYFKEGIWYGIELEEAVGKNNGSFGGHTYFQCPDKHGVFVRRDKIRRK